MLRQMRWRIAFPYMILILLTMIGLIVYVSITLRERYLSDLEEELVAYAMQISHSFSFIADNMDPLQINELSAEWADILDARVTIINAGGDVIGESHINFAEMENHINRPEIQDSLVQSYGSSIRFSSTVGYRMMYVAVQVNQIPGIDGFVRVALPTTQIEESILNMQKGLLIVMVIVMGISFLIAVVIADATSKPLRVLVNNAVNLSEEAGVSNEIDKYQSTINKGEIDQLTSIINASIKSINRQMEQVQAESTKMNEVLDHMTDGVLIADAQGRIQLINPAAENLFDIRSNDAIGRSIAEVLRHHQLIELWQRCQESDQLQSISMEIGLERSYLNGIATPLGEGIPGGILFLFQDLTRVKKLEIMRRDFVSNISHEIRTPLASLKALSETLMENALDDPTAARKFLQQINVEIDSLTQIVEELLELSRIESGIVPLKLKPITPKSVINTAIDRLDVQFKRARLNIEIICPDNIAPILADRVRIERVLVNLLHNAIKFTPRGGDISISARDYTEGEDQFVIFTIKDSGVGIPVTDIPRIFERFYKSDRSRSSGGTGLGLSIAQHIVLIHGGRIWAESIEGEGSSFFFTIPASKE